MARVPPTMTTDPPRAMSGPPAAGSRLLVPLPRLGPAVRMPGRRLRGLGLDPADAFRADVVEAVYRSDAGEHDVAGPERVVPPVKLRLDLAGDEEVGLLERVIV